MKYRIPTLALRWLQMQTLSRKAVRPEEYGLRPMMLLLRLYYVGAY